MTDRNKAVLKQANAAIEQGDIEGFLAHCTDDIQWTTVGESTLDGKAAVRAWMIDTYIEPPRFDVHRLIAEDDIVVALGEIALPGADGGASPQPYADVWRFRDGKMAELRAFVIG